MQAYLAKNDLGEYKIPVIRQRPILLMGPPGIGKTQIMEQIAAECRIGLVSYTITHHTRQSAVGLPFIREKEYGGKSCSVTEYTMSEILASVYDRMEETGLSEGILFLDEINCVSETLAPTMLQFLQCKTFGNRKLPEGWLIVAAGNPPEYNKSVREFDMVTLDRIRVIPVEADYKVWRSYALERKITPALLSYLELHPADFYRIEADVDGIQYVTARGWEDLGSLYRLYQEMQISMTEDVIYEFLHHKDVAENVAAYLELYEKYRDDYHIERILKGQIRPELFARLDAAAFDERLTVTGLLLDGLTEAFYRTSQEVKRTDLMFDFLRAYRHSQTEEISPADRFARQIKEQEESWEKEKQDGFLTAEDWSIRQRVTALLKEILVQKKDSSDVIFEMARSRFEEQKNRLLETEETTAQMLEHAFDFMEDAFGNGEEMVVFVTELTVSRYAAEFLAEHDCERYDTYSRTLLVGTRRGELLSELKR